jgi:hypothetical protein
MKYVLVSGGQYSTRAILPGKECGLIVFPGVISGIGKGVIGMHLNTQLSATLQAKDGI